MKKYIQPQTEMFEIRTAEHLLSVSTQDSGSTLNVSIDQSDSKTVGSSSGVWTREKKGGGNSGMWSDMQ